MIYTNYFPHPFSSFLMSRIKPVKLARQNVLVRKENQGVKRTKDWQLAAILGILFISRVYTFLFKCPKNEPLFVSYSFSFDRKDRIFLTSQQMGQWGGSWQLCRPSEGFRNNQYAFPLVHTLPAPEMPCSWLRPKLSTRKKPAWLAKFTLWVSSPGTPRTVPEERVNVQAVV